MSNQDTADTIVVFTARSPERIVREGGSQAWVLNPARAKRCRYLVCTQNRHHADHEFSDATEPHGTAYLLGKISLIGKSPERGERWLIGISEFARINVPNAWDHGRNPVRYTSLGEMGISVDKLEFHPVSKDDDAPMKERTRHSRTAASGTPTLTIAEAKKALSVSFGVKPEAIEITIRG